MTAAEWDCFGSVTKPTTRALLPMSGFYWPQCDCHCVSVWLCNKANVTVTFFRGKSDIYFLFYYYLSQWQPKKRRASFRVTVMQLRLSTSSWAPLVREKMQKKVINSSEILPLIQEASSFQPDWWGSLLFSYFAVKWILLLAAVRDHLLHERGVDPPGHHWLLVKLPVEESQLRDSFTMMHSNISRSNPLSSVAKTWCRQRDWNQKNENDWCGSRQTPFYPTKRFSIV